MLQATAKVPPYRQLESGDSNDFLWATVLLPNVSKPNNEAPGVF
jgi:hypothetical protein